MSSLMKLAAETPVLPTWGDPTSPSDTAHKELASNKDDQRKELGNLFESTSAAQKAETKDVKTLLPIANKSNETASSNPMLKVATHRAFFDGVRRTGIFKAASPDYLRAAFAAFDDELSKMAGIPLGKVFKGKRPGLVSPAAVPSSWGPGTVVRAGS